MDMNFFKWLEKRDAALYKTVMAQYQVYQGASGAPVKHTPPPIPSRNAVDPLTKEIESVGDDPVDLAELFVKVYHERAAKPQHKEALASKLDAAGCTIINGTNFLDVQRQLARFGIGRHSITTGRGESKPGLVGPDHSIWVQPIVR
jgi:hypothetical protein